MHLHFACIESGFGLRLPAVMNLHILMHQRVWRTFLLISSFVVIRSCHVASDLPMVDTTSFSPVVKETTPGNMTSTIRMSGLEFSGGESERIVVEEDVGPPDNSGPPRINYLRSRRSSGKRRPLRDVSYNTEEKSELLRLHNLYRSNVTPPAADMKYMEWDESLADMALEWAEHLSSIEGCPLKHGLPASKKNYEGSVGQNLYSGNRNGTRALYLWYEEHKDYNFRTMECVPGKMCGQYTQMVWGDSVKVGCNVASCLRQPNRYIVVCHYNPAGNYLKTHPYSVGMPCSQCDTPDGGLCYKNQCVTKSLCKRENLPCRCNLKCHNCGYLNKGACRCECKKGWDSLDCSQPCRNIHRFCGKSPGFSNKNFCYLNERLVERKFCRQMCGQCQPAVEDNDLEDTCCSGKMCPPGEVLFGTQEAFCSCRKLCPGPDCER